MEFTASSEEDVGRAVEPVVGSGKRMPDASTRSRSNSHSSTQTEDPEAEAPGPEDIANLMTKLVEVGAVLDTATSKYEAEMGQVMGVLESIFTMPSGPADKKVRTAM